MKMPVQAEEPMTAHVRRPGGNVPFAVAELEGYQVGRSNRLGGAVNNAFSSMMYVLAALLLHALRLFPEAAEPFSCRELLRLQSHDKHAPSAKLYWKRGLSMFSLLITIPDLFAVLGCGLWATA